jgi:tRNA nucleotidyltransferase/poly(A) polymerase
VARFVAELGFDVSADLLDAMRSGAPALAEADPAECETSLRRLFAGPHRSAAIALLHEVAAPRRLPPPWRERLAAAC